MVRRAGVLAVVAAALVIAPAAAAWTRVASLAYPVDLVALRTRAGSELLAWEGGPAGLVPRSVLVLRVGGVPHSVAFLADGEQFTEGPVLLRRPGGGLLLYYSTTRGVFRLASADDGRDWSEAAATALGPRERVLAGAVRPDGTPLLTLWNWSGDSDEEPVLEVAQGLDGDRRHRIAVDGRGSVAVTLANRAYLLYSVNPGEFVSAEPGTYVQRLDAAGAPFGRRRRFAALPAAPITVDRLGRVLVPAQRGDRLLVVDVGRARWATHVVARGVWLGWGAPLMEDPRGGLSVLWRVDRAYFAARSPGRGFHFVHRTASVEPPDLGRTRDGAPASTAALAWAGGVDLFAAYDDRILRERFRVD
jgi:hypothetical protein